MLYTDMAIKINQYIDTLQEPQRFFMYLLIYAGTPLLLVFLAWLSNRLEKRKIKKTI